MTLEEIRDAINSICEEISEAGAAIGTDLSRDAEGFIIDQSDLGIAVRAIDRAVMRLSRLSYKLSET